VGGGGVHVATGRGLVPRSRRRSVRLWATSVHSTTFGDLCVRRVCVRVCGGSEASYVGGELNWVTSLVIGARRRVTTTQKDLNCSLWTLFTNILLVLISAAHAPSGQSSSLLCGLLAHTFLPLLHLGSEKAAIAESKEAAPLCVHFALFELLGQETRQSRSGWARLTCAGWMDGQRAG